jgi:hypothetical protein
MPNDKELNFELCSLLLINSLTMLFTEYISLVKERERTRAGGSG